MLDLPVNVRASLKPAQILGSVLASAARVRVDQALVEHGGKRDGVASGHRVISPVLEGGDF
jgi:hypothetical protein